MYLEEVARNSCVDEQVLDFFKEQREMDDAKQMLSGCEGYDNEGK
ncbi:predicted protein [Sclerotinia sclerotiorum 1980 UF-70]|uniref:Uncharacterized protein n=1 Tax=Sclerotinia sclerotiorum (strain ATCC 18683 / 1980 / Ss-1) TaxID=665079 RepID=A7FA62_SCLS1|nr:predicted protein [Sclerotinia sclerotiorum 1980 UF-70]EDO00623.1 predicted protein [Sclerotinia sclerotiorum 1980 UF-70]